MAKKPTESGAAKGSTSKGKECEDSCSCQVNRREFLKTSGAGAVLLSALGSSFRDACAAEGIHPSHLVPLEKNLSPDWLEMLFARGEREVHRGDALGRIGMPIGGIAAGQMYLLGDGSLGCWHIFNRPVNTGPGNKCYDNQTFDKPVDQGFAVTVKSASTESVTRLNEQGPWEIEFVGEYPIAEVRYRSDQCPVSVTLEAFSPFIPLNAEDSGLPATVFNFTVENACSVTIEAAVAGWLENAVCCYSQQALGSTRLTSTKKRTVLYHSAREIPKSMRKEERPNLLFAGFEGLDYGEWTVEGEAFGTAPAEGTLPNQNQVSGFAGKRLVNTYFGGDDTQGVLTSPIFVISRKSINFLVGGGNHKGKTCVNLLVGGNVVRTATGASSEQLKSAHWNVEEFEGQHAQIQIVDKATGGWGHILVDNIEFSDTPASQFSGPFRKRSDYGSMALALAGESLSNEETRRLLSLQEGFAQNLTSKDDSTYLFPKRETAAISTTFATLAPGETATFTFVLSWHFPNAQHGRYYANRFKNARTVAEYILENRDTLTSDTRLWREVYHDGTLPYWLLDRLMYTVSNLATETCQWWKDGRFWAYEGVGCCHGTCTHVWNYAHALARLFPELERSARQMQDLGVALQESGLVSFRGEPNGRYAADGQAGTVLKCCREHQMSPDDKFLKRNWEKIKRVLEYSIQQDDDDDGLIENTQHNTYDINFEGPNTFVGALYLAALRAGEKMAIEMNDVDFAQRVRKIFENGSRLSVERLWNGEYFLQIVDTEKYASQYGDGCLSDQLFGQGWAHQLNLGYLYPEPCVHKTLESIWKYNSPPILAPFVLTPASKPTMPYLLLS